MRLLGGKNSLSFVMWQAASFSNNRHKISSKTQNERWMAEDLYGIIIFFENIVKPTLNLAKIPLENPGKEFHFYCWPPCYKV